MPYVTRAAVETLIPPLFLIEALDDDGDRQEDAGLWDAIAAEADAAVDAYLSRRYALPFDVVPQPAVEAAKIFACEMLHQRRGSYGSKNPFTSRAAGFRKLLESIATGAVGLGPDHGSAAPSISIISEPAGTVPASRLNA